VGSQSAPEEMVSLELLELGKSSSSSVPDVGTLKMTMTGRNNPLRRKFNEK